MKQLTLGITKRKKVSIQKRLGDHCLQQQTILASGLDMGFEVWERRFVKLQLLPKYAQTSLNAGPFPCPTSLAPLAWCFPQMTAQNAGQFMLCAESQ